VPVGSTEFCWRCGQRGVSWRYCCILYYRGPTLFKVYYLATTSNQHAMAKKTTCLKSGRCYPDNLRMNQTIWAIRTVFERKATGALLGLIPIIGYIAWRTSEGSDPVSKAHSEESDSASFPRDAVARYASRSSCKQVISQCLVPRPAGLRDFVSWFKNSNSPPPPDEAE